MQDKDFITKNALSPVHVYDYRLQEGGTLPLLQYPLLTDTGIVKHGFTTREGGVSGGVFQSLNLSFSRGDREDDVRENYRRVAEVFGCGVEQIVCPYYQCPSGGPFIWRGGRDERKALHGCGWPDHQ